MRSSRRRFGAKNRLPLRAVRAVPQAPWPLGSSPPSRTWFRHFPSFSHHYLRSMEPRWGTSHTPPGVSFGVFGWTYQPTFDNRRFWPIL
jgi:hypothetical protein